MNRCSEAKQITPSNTDADSAAGWPAAIAPRRMDDREDVSSLSRRRRDVSDSHATKSARQLLHGENEGITTEILCIVISYREV